VLEPVLDRLICLPQDQIAVGLKEALSKGAQSAIESLGKPDGFLKNANVKIPMPKHLSMVEKGLRTIGQDGGPINSSKV
jgi:hypothetical protein